jgi:hypothetical protein
MHCNVLCNAKFSTGSPMGSSIPGPLAGRLQSTAMTDFALFQPLLTDDLLLLDLFLYFETL